MSLKVELMTEQKRERNMCNITVKLFYRPVGHKKEMEGCSPNHYCSGTKEAGAEKGNLNPLNVCRKLIWLIVENQTSVFISFVDME